MNTTLYDTIIVGAGPSGLTLAQHLSKVEKKILVIDANNNIGGCHRVRRIPINNEYIFTEHGPRIYCTNYLNFFNNLNELGLNYNDYFETYKYKAIDGIKQAFKQMHLKDMFWIGIGFFKFIINRKYGNDISLLSFAEKHNFSNESIEFLHRFSYLPVEKPANKVRLSMLYNFFNDNAFYKVLQPSKPLDISLWKDVKTNLENSGLEFNLETRAVSILQNGILVESNDEYKFIKAKKIVCATKLPQLVNILNESPQHIQNAFGDFNSISELGERTKYDESVSITFHWDTELQLPDKWGFSYNSPWSLLFIVLSDYIKFDESKSKTVISVGIQLLNAKSPHTGKTPNESTKEELFTETLRQLGELLNVELPLPTLSLLNPGNIKKGNEWIDVDSGFCGLTDHDVLPSKANINVKEQIPIYSLGIYNEKTYTLFDALETAVVSGIHLVNDLYPQLQIPIKERFTITSLFDTIFPFLKRWN